MENRNKFDLVQNIDNWKLLLRQKNLTIDNISELESHLYEEIDNLKEIGLTEKEAFIISKNRIGEIDEISFEFEKVNGNILFIKKIVPYIKGLLFFIGFITITELFTKIILYAGVNLGLKNEYLQILLIGIFLLFTIVFYWSIFIKYKTSKVTIIDKVNKIPTLLLLIVFSKILLFFTSILLVKIIGQNDFAIISVNLYFFNILFVVFLLIFFMLLNKDEKNDRKEIILRS